MPEKKLAALFLEIFLIALILTTLSSIALPQVGRMIGNDANYAPVGRVAGMEPACSKNKTLHDYFQDLIDYPRGFNTTSTVTPALP
jgi:hypothetical protein